jgi:hypothetical protein
MGDPTKSKHSYRVVYENDRGEQMNPVTTRSCKYAGITARVWADAGMKRVWIEVTRLPGVEP